MDKPNKTTAADILSRIGGAIEGQMARDDNHPNDLARAALIAMREATPAMIDAAMNRNADIEGEMIYAGIWRAMIASAGEGVAET